MNPEWEGKLIILLGFYNLNEKPKELPYHRQLSTRLQNETPLLDGIRKELSTSCIWYRNSHL